MYISPLHACTIVKLFVFPLIFTTDPNTHTTIDDLGKHRYVYVQDRATTCEISKPHKYWPNPIMLPAYNRYSGLVVEKWAKEKVLCRGEIMW